MHSCLISCASTLRLTLLIAALVAPITFSACGSGSAASAAVRPPVVLPPAIPAAEPVLLFVGAGTADADVASVEGILGTLGIGYTTANSGQLNAMSEQQLAGYKLLIIPGGNSITIGQYLTVETASAIRGAVEDYGVHYLGLCAGAFFGGYSSYNGVNLTGGVPFDFYADEFKGIHAEPVEISLPGNSSMDVFWQDGPQLSGWGSVVAKFPDGTPAIVEGQSGKGFVIFTGVHPEAPPSWRAPFVFSTSISVDLEYAGTVIQAALDGTGLSHF